MQTLEEHTYRIKISMQTQREKSRHHMLTSVRSDKVHVYALGDLKGSKITLG